MSITETRTLLEGNRRYVSEKTQEDPNFFETLASGQAPKFLWIGCSDSRIPVSMITGGSPGDIFIHRNIANLVVNTDLNLLCVLTYAVEHLKVQHIIVCGHYGCGGIKAATSNQSLGLLDTWLMNIKDVYAKHRDELDELEGEQRCDRLSEWNVRQQVLNLCKTACVQEAWQREVPLQVHGWIYQLSSGLLHDLDVNISGPSDLNSVYHL